MVSKNTKNEDFTCINRKTSAYIPQNEPHFTNSRKTSAYDNLAGTEKEQECRNGLGPKFLFSPGSQTIH